MNEERRKRLSVGDKDFHMINHVDLSISYRSLRCTDHLGNFLGHRIGHKFLSLSVEADFSRD